MFSVWRMVLQTGVGAFLTASVLLAQAARPAAEATEFFKKYDPTSQLVDAVKKVGVAGKGGGGGGLSPADRKHCDGQLTATPKQADQLMRRLFAGARETAEKAGARLHGPKELPRNETPSAFHLAYAQDACAGEVAVTLKQGEAATSRGAFRYFIQITIVESRAAKKP